MRKKMIKLAITVIFVLTVVIITILIVFRDVPAEMMREAMGLREAEKFEEAADLFGKIALMYPESPVADDALFWQGHTYFVDIFPHVSVNDKGLYIKLSLNIFEELIEKYSGSSHLDEAHMNLGKIYTIVGEEEKALVSFEARLKLVDDPTVIQEIRYEMAKRYESLNKEDEATKELKEVIAIGTPSTSYENAYLKLASYYRIYAEEDDVDVDKYHEGIIDLLHHLLNGKVEVSDETRKIALEASVLSLLELKRFDECEEALDRWEMLERSRGFEINPTTRDLINDYRNRLESHRKMGKKGG